VGASIYWQPLDKKRDLEIWAPSSFMEALKRAFDRDFPMDLDDADLPVLRGMAAVSGDKNNDFATLVRLIEDKGPVRIWAEY